jgi:hypothetical protein
MTFDRILATLDTAHQYALILTFTYRDRVRKTLRHRPAAIGSSVRTQA